MPVFGWMANLFGGLHVARWLHPWAGVLLSAAMLWMFLHWLGDMRLTPRDREWLGPKALAYMKERKAFGKRLDEFQALQFRLADMAIELEAARTFVWRAAAALDRKDADATKLCAMAKRFGTDVGFEVANQALQLHGGYGYLSEYGIEKIVRDLRVHQILEGTNEIMRLIVSRKLIEGTR